MNWTTFISKWSWPIQGTITALSGNNWRKTREPLRIWRIRAGMWTGTSRTQIQSPTDTPITVRQNPSCAKSFYFFFVNWHGVAQNRVHCQISFFAITTRKKRHWFWWKKMRKYYRYKWGVDSSLHVKVVTTGLCLVSILSVCGSNNTQGLHR